MKVLFVCVDNSNRSQMAEAFGKKYATADMVIYSAGSKPSGKVNPLAIQYMAEIDLDLSKNESISVNDLPFDEFDAVISMGCVDDCPMINTKLREDWQIPDPKHLPADDFRTVRDYIEIKVKDLFKRLQQD